MFDFVQFCEEHRIPYIVRGVNKKVSDDCNISCPFCNSSADPDPSMHLGIDSQKGVYSCWRNPRQHRGRTLHKLIMKLIRCSYYEACELLGQQSIWLKEGSFELLADDPNNFFKESSSDKNELMFPEEFRSFGTTLQAEQRFIGYLQQRGFSTKQITALVQHFHLKWAIAGRYKQRIIIPLQFQQRWVGWTSRSIHSKESIRYLTLSDAEGALINIKKMIFNWDQLIEQPAEIVVVCEGPFDAMTLDLHGQRLGIRATCLFNQMATMEQLAYIAALTDLYQYVLILLDDTATMYAESIKDQLPGYPLEVMQLPTGIHDPGELTMSQVWTLSKQWFKQLEIK
jgi:hypothetical protein